MNRFVKVPMLAFLALLVFAPLASARPTVGHRGDFERGGFGYGPGWYQSGWEWYGPELGWYEPYGDMSGKVRIDTAAKDTQILVDGGYAGTVKHIKSFWLKPGAHDIELRHPDGQSFYQEHISVIVGKTIDIRPTV